MRIVGAVALITLANTFDEIGRGSIDRIMDAVYWILTMTGLSILIWHWFQTEKYPEIRREKLLLDGMVYAEFKKRREKGRKTYALMAIAGMALLVLGTELAGFLANTVRLNIYSISAGILEWVTDAVGLALTMWAVMSVTAENRIVRNTEGVPRMRRGRYAWFYWGIPVTALAFLIGCVAHTWNPMVPLIVLLCALLVTVCKLLAERRESK